MEAFLLVSVQRKRLGDDVGNLLGSFRYGNNIEMLTTSGHRTPSKGGWLEHWVLCTWVSCQTPARSLKGFFGTRNRVDSEWCGRTIWHDHGAFENSAGWCPRVFVVKATLFVRGHIPEDILTVVRVGRMIALQKPDGGVRAIVVGDVFRRLVARIIVKQFAEQVKDVTHLLKGRKVRV